MKDIDINCDCGESTSVFGDELLMPYISSCNIACGGHTGELESMKQTVLSALKHGVRPGAHPSLPDKKGFGRNWFDMDAQALRDEIKNQISSLNSICISLNTVLHHVKAHGALYNKASVDKYISIVMVTGIIEAVGNVKLYAPYDSELYRTGRNEGLIVCCEVFADRNYLSDGSLVPRNWPNAIIESESEVYQRFKHVFCDGVIRTIDGIDLQVQVDTICFHSDHPRTLDLLKFIHSKLNGLGLKLAK